MSAVYRAISRPVGNLFWSLMRAANSGFTAPREVPFSCFLVAICLIKLRYSDLFFYRFYDEIVRFDKLSKKKAVYIRCHRNQ